MKCLKINLVFIHLILCFSVVNLKSLNITSLEEIDENENTSLDIQTEKNDDISSSEKRNLKNLKEDIASIGMGLETFAVDVAKQVFNVTDENVSTALSKDQEISDDNLGKIDPKVNLTNTENKIKDLLEEINFYLQYELTTNAISNQNNNNSINNTLENAAIQNKTENSNINSKVIIPNYLSSVELTTKLEGDLQTEKSTSEIPNDKDLKILEKDTSNLTTTNSNSTEPEQKLVRKKRQVPQIMPENRQNMQFYEENVGDPMMENEEQIPEEMNMQNEIGPNMRIPEMRENNEQNFIEPPIIRNKCPAVNDELLKKQHLSDLKEEVSKLQDLVHVLKEQEKVLRILNEKNRAVEQDKSQKNNEYDLIKILQELNNSNKNNTTINVSENEIIPEEQKNTANIEVPIKTKSSESEIKFKNEDQIKKLEEELEETIVNLNHTKAILEEEKKKDNKLERDVKHQKIEINWLKLIIQQLLMGKQTSKDDELDNLLYDKDVLKDIVNIGNLNHNMTNQKDNIDNILGSKRSEFSTKNKTEPRLSDEEENLVLHQSRSSEFSELAKLINSIDTEKKSDSADLDNSIEIQSKLLDLESQLKKKRQEAELKKELSLLQLKLKQLQPKEEKSFLNDDDTDAEVKKLRFLLKRIKKPESKSEVDSFDDELRDLQKAIDELRPKQEFELENSVSKSDNDNKQFEIMLNKILAGNQGLGPIKQPLPSQIEQLQKLTILQNGGSLPMMPYGNIENYKGEAPYGKYGYQNYGQLYDQGNKYGGYSGQYGEYNAPIAPYSNKQGYIPNQYGPMPYSSNKYNSYSGQKPYDSSNLNYVSSLLNYANNKGGYNGATSNNANFGSNIGGYGTQNSYGGAMNSNYGSSSPLPNSYGGGMNSYYGSSSPLPNSYAGSGLNYGGPQGSNSYPQNIGKAPSYVPYENSGMGNSNGYSPSSSGPNYPMNQYVPTNQQIDYRNNFFHAPQGNKQIPQENYGNGAQASTQNQAQQYQTSSNGYDASNVHNVQNIQELKYQIDNLQNVINNLNRPEYTQKPEDKTTISNLNKQIGDLKNVVNVLNQDNYGNQDQKNQQPHGGSDPVSPQQNYEQQSTKNYETNDLQSNLDYGSKEKTEQRDSAVKSRKRRSIEDNKIDNKNKETNKVEDSPEIKQFMDGLHDIVQEINRPDDDETNVNMDKKLDGKQNNLENVQNRIAQIQNQLESIQNLTTQPGMATGRSSYDSYDSYPSYQSNQNNQHHFNFFPVEEYEDDVKSKLRTKKIDFFTEVAGKITDKVLAALPVVLHKILNFLLNNLGGGVDDYNSGYGGGYGGVQNVFKNLGFFGIIPLLILRSVSVVDATFSLLQKNKFLKTFLIPAGVVLLVAGSVIFLIWWLQPNSDGYGNGYNNYENDGYDNKNYGGTNYNNNNYNDKNDYYDSKNSNYKNPNNYISNYQSNAHHYGTNSYLNNNNYNKPSNNYYKSLHDYTNPDSSFGNSYGDLLKYYNSNNYGRSYFEDGKRNSELNSDFNRNAIDTNVIVRNPNDLNGFRNDNSDYYNYLFRNNNNGGNNVNRYSNYIPKEM